MIYNFKGSWKHWLGVLICVFISIGIEDLFFSYLGLEKNRITRLYLIGFVGTIYGLIYGTVFYIVAKKRSIPQNKSK